MDSLINKIHCSDCLEMLKTLPDNSIHAVVTDPPYGLSFMNKKWDYDIPSTDIWQECYRVLKPGGHLLAFAGTRTQHRMACRIEDAGFEIRDMLSWVYCNGFPKSLNIGFAIDKKLGNQRQVVGNKRAGMGSGETFGMLQAEGQNTNKELNSGVVAITKGNSDWEGWGTALKPAVEPITMARKPIKGTIADNILSNGTGGLNVQECRIPFVNDKDKKSSLVGYEQDDRDNTIVKVMTSPVVKPLCVEDVPEGRFPANFIHDGSEEVLELFPYSDLGSAARVFYCPKPSREERDMGCGKGIDKYKAGRDYRPSHKIRAENGDDGTAYGRFGVIKNNHPTVKPIKLMSYLVKMVSRHGQIVLDPFAGSGTTLLACYNVGVDFIGIEREAEYVEIANNRLAELKNNLFELAKEN